MLAVVRAVEVLAHLFGPLYIGVDPFSWIPDSLERRNP
jgi:hypothetical protein